MARRNPHRRWVLITLAVVVMAGYFLTYSLHSGQPGNSDGVTELTKLQETALSTMLEANKLGIQLALLLFGAWGALLLADAPIIRLSSLPDVILMVISLAATTLSLHTGYLQYDRIVEMLAAGYFDPNSTLVLKPRSLQVDSLLVSLSTLAIGAVLAGQRNASSGTEAHGKTPPKKRERD